MAAIAEAKQLIAKASRPLFLTGAGISAESGVPTFRGEGGLWRTFRSTDLASPDAFRQDPSLVWEFYHYRRNLVSKCRPNRGHRALAAFEAKLQKEGKQVDILTQNVDGLHHLAGSKNVTELHGSLWRVKRVGERGFLDEEGKVWEDRTNPIVAALEGRGSPKLDDSLPSVPLDELPHVEEADGGRTLLRPAVVWFGEALDSRVMDKVEELLEQCDALIVVGTSSVVYPAAAFAPQVTRRGVPVIDINLEINAQCSIGIEAKAGEVLPEVLDVENEV